MGSRTAQTSTSARKMQARKNRGLIVINGTKQIANIEEVHNVARQKLKVSQHRLAHIQELQSRLAFDHEQLEREWRAVRQEMMSGSEIELGPIRAFLKYSLRYVHKHGSKRRLPQHWTRLVVK